MSGTSSWTSTPASRAFSMPDDDRQRLVAHPDPRRGVLGEVAVAGDDHDDGLADVVDLVLGQAVADARVGERGVRDEDGQRLGDPAGEVLPGVDRLDALDLPRVVDVDVDDPGVGVRAADERGLERAAAEVVEVAAVAGEQAGVLAALDLLAELAGAHRACPRPRSPATGLDELDEAAADLGGAADRRDDVLVPGAAAEVPRDGLAGLLGRGVGVVLEVRGDRRDEPRCAEAALEAVALGERLLHRAEVLGVVADPLDGGDLVRLGRDGEHQARPHRLAVDEDGARAADAVLAADVGAGEAEVVAQEVGEEAARGRGRGAGDPVDPDRHLVLLLGGGLAHAAPSSSSSMVVTRTRRVSSAASIRR